MNKNNNKLKVLLCMGLWGMTASNIANASPFFTCPSGDVIDLAVTSSASCPTSTSTSTSTSSSSSSSHQASETILDQQTRQIVRQISSYINDRVAADINPAFFGPGTENPAGASADGHSLMPDSLWSAFSWSRLSNDGTTPTGNFDTDIYQTTTGIDKKIGNFYFGTTLTYAGSSSAINPSTQGSSHNVGLTPYAAYVFNKNLFLSAMTGYNYNTNSYRGAQPESEADAYQTELDLNGLHVIDQWFMKGKIGARYLHTHSKFDPVIAGGAVTRTNQDGWTYLVDSQIGYSFKNGLRAFSGVLYEYNNPKPNKGRADGVFYYSGGVDYSVNKKLTLGTSVQTDLNNPQVDLTTVALTARLNLD